jgi:hypothetical protein
LALCPSASTPPDSEGPEIGDNPRPPCTVLMLLWPHDFRNRKAKNQEATSRMGNPITVQSASPIRHDIE